MRGRSVTLRSAFDRLISRAAAPFPGAVRWWAERSATARPEGPVPWTPFTARFAQARAAVVTTGGFHRMGQPPFDCDRGDPSFREIPAAVDPRELVITHTHYDSRDARSDPNILLPLERLAELVDEGVLGSLAPTHYSLMGYIPQVDVLTGRTAPAIAGRLADEGVGLVLLVPA